MPIFNGYIFKSVKSKSTVAVYGSNANLKSVFKALDTNGWQLSDKPMEFVDGELVIWIY